VCRPSRSRSVSDLRLLLDLDLIVASFLDLIWLCLVITYVISMPKNHSRRRQQPLLYQACQADRRWHTSKRPNQFRFFFRKHRPVMVQFAACQIDVDCLLLLHAYLCMYMLSLYAQICYYSISLLLIHAKKSLCLHSYMPKEIWRILIHNGTSC
jgi:hypothetical protein